MTLAFCWAHARRKFKETQRTTKSKIAAEAIKRIGTLYALEQEIRGLPPNARLKERLRYSKPRVEDLRVWLKDQLQRVSAKGSIGKAINYLLENYDEFSVFLADGRVEMDNNAVENAIRPIVMLRKNALFCGSEDGGKQWMIMASLIGTCRMNGVEPYAYLNWVFDHMANKLPRSRYDELLPWNCPVGRFPAEDDGDGE